MLFIPKTELKMLIDNTVDTAGAVAGSCLRWDSLQADTAPVPSAQPELREAELRIPDRIFD